MTTDAKVGLLLGLVFIVIIAFLINGLPNFIKADQTQGANSPSVTLQDKSLVIGAQTSQAVALTDSPVPLRSTEPPSGSEVIHVFSTAEAAMTATAEAPEPVSTEPESAPAGAQTSKPEPQAASAVVEAVKNPSSGQIYTVVPGDSLASIAVKFYGTDLGNRKNTIQKFFEANQNTLQSQDKILVGQKLTVPPASTMEQNEAVQAILSTGMFEKTTKPGQKPQPKSEPKSGNKPTSILQKIFSGPKTVEYVVKPDDSLWKIAATQLGDGKRYKEILEMNRETIKDPDNVPAGVRLKLPQNN